MLITCIYFYSSEDDSSAIPDKGDATPAQTTGVTIPATTSATLDKLSSTAPFDLQRSRGRDRLKKGQKKFGQKKFEKWVFGSTFSENKIKYIRLVLHKINIK